MKTVKDYLDLGLAFVDSDKLLSISNDKDSKEVCMSGLCIAHQRYCDGFRGGNAIFFYASEWTPSSFAWRDNDGVKPEYKGLIEFTYNGEGCEMQEFRGADSINWSIVKKWRPVALQSDDANKKIREKFISALRTASKAKNVTFKADRLNIDGREYLIPSRTPTVSPKEDKPMRPVYTAEMHARNELPPIGSMVLVDAEAESGVKYKDHPTILADVSGELPQLKVMAILTSDVGRRVAVLQNKNNECHCFKLSSVRPIKPIIKTIKVNGFDVPAPMSEAPEIDSKYFVIDLLDKELFSDIEWEGDCKDFQWLQKGIVHSTKSAAIAHAKAMLGINPNPTRSGDGYDRNVLGQNNEGDEI